MMDPEADVSALDRNHSQVHVANSSATNSHFSPPPVGGGGVILSDDLTSVVAKEALIMPDEADNNEDFAITTDGRRPTRKRSSINTPIMDESTFSPPSMTKKRIRNHSGTSESLSCDANIEMTTTISTTGGTDENELVNNAMSWICMECKEAEAALDENSVLVLCEGSCNRPFHLICVGLQKVPSQDWKCADCMAARHVCSICQEYGMDFLDVFPCKKKGCGLFYHESCLSMVHVDIKHVQRGATNGEMQVFETTNENGRTAVAHQVNHINLPSETIPEFKCPAHRCWTCTEDMVLKDGENDDDAPVIASGGKKKGRGKKTRKPKDNAFGVKTGNLFKCLECCIAYHVSCISPFARFHELALLCHDHAATGKLPYLDLETSLQAKVERAADKRMETLKGRKTQNGTNSMSRNEENKFFLRLKGDAISSEEGTMLSHLEEYAERYDKTLIPSQLSELLFCLPCDVKEEVYSKPPNFRMVQSLRYIPNNRPKRKDPSGESCNCRNVVLCDEHCINRVMGIECTGDPAKGNGLKNPYWNCEVGPNCGNRSLGLRQSAKCKPQREQGRGWGLICLEGIKKGFLVQEYVGEVIDEKTKEERLSSWAKDHPNDPNFYIMHLDYGWYIDARVEANLSRFINHSCEPNCVLRPVTVAGYTRNGIYAARDIAPGEFLSYDYRFDTKHGDKFICRCGSQKCRGTMKGGKQSVDQDDEQKSLKQALAEAKAREDKDRKYLEEIQRIKETNFSQVDFMVPAADYPGESVALGPHERHRYEGVNNRVFLWRNCTLGGNFWNRALRLEAGERRNKRKRNHSQTLGKIDVFATLAVLPSV